MESTCDQKHGSRRNCAMADCDINQARSPGLHFFKFPVSRPAICEQWVTNCANDLLENLPQSALRAKIVCEKHFTDDSFTSTLRTRLKLNAVPTLLQTCSPKITPPQAVPSSSFQFTENTQHTSSPYRTPTKSKRSLLSSLTEDPSTPLYKKYKSIKGRKQTPKKNYSPGRKILLKRLENALKSKKKCQQALSRKMKKVPTISTDMMISAVQSSMPEKVALFIAMQLRHADTKKTPWTEEEKKQTLAMRYKSPALYDHMRSDGFFLPSPSTIARWLQVVDLRPGISSEMFQSLKVKVGNMSSWEKNAVILFDEMSIKSSLDYDGKRDLVEGVLDLDELGRKPEPGTHVLLFMARGLFHKWKMPVAYFVTNSNVQGHSVSSLITSVMASMKDVGLRVRAVVCDQSSVNRKALQLLGVTKCKPFITSNEKIYFLFDFPHVIKCIRNNLMKGAIQFETSDSIDTEVSTNASIGSGLADWKHIVTLYNIDLSSSTARATRLTERHLKPNSFEKMSVKLATQVFSHSVSSAMVTAAETEQLPQAAINTAFFLKKINNIFDSMNSLSKFHPNPNKCALSDSLNAHAKVPRKTLESGLHWVKSWKMENNTRPPSFHGIEHSLHSTLLLWEDLKKDGAAFLLTGRLNQDPIENEFSIARQKCGYNRNPSARLFRQNLRHRIQAALMKPPAGGNCEPDDDDLLCTTSATESGPSSSGQASNSPTHDEEVQIQNTSDDDDCSEAAEDILKKEQSLEMSSVRYFAGYAVRACLKRYKCKDCERELLQHSDSCTSTASTSADLTRNREYNRKDDDVLCLLYVNDRTARVVHTALMVVNNHIHKYVHVMGLLKKILLKAKRQINKEDELWLKGTGECSQHRSFVLQKIITAKLKRKLQEISKEMRQPGGKKSKYWRKVRNLSNN